MAEKTENEKLAVYEEVKVSKSGLPRDFPRWSVVYNHFREWEVQGVWEAINAKLSQKYRAVKGRESKPPDFDTF